MKKILLAAALMTSVSFAWVDEIRGNVFTSTQAGLSERVDVTSYAVLACENGDMKMALTSNGSRSIPNIDTLEIDFSGEVPNNDAIISTADGGIFVFNIDAGFIEGLEGQYILVSFTDRDKESRFFYIDLTAITYTRAYKECK